MKVFAPTTLDEFRDILHYVEKLNCPVAIRYPKCSCLDRKTLPLKDGLWERVKEGDKVTILAVGPRMLKLALEVAEKMDGVSVISARSVKPLDEKVLDEIRETLIVTLEENSLIGGFASMVNGYYAYTGEKIFNFGVKDEFVHHGSINKQMEENGLTVENIISVLDAKIKG